MTDDAIPLLSASRPRVDWLEFFRRYAQPHGLRVFMPHLDAAAEEARRTEARLLTLIKRHRGAGPYALRRSFGEGPPRVECAFYDKDVADELATLIGAVPGPAPVGYRTFRRLAAYPEDCERIWRLGAGSAVAPAWGKGGPEATAQAIETLARAIVRDVHVFAEGKPGRWVPLELVSRRLVLLDDRKTEAAVQRSVILGWMVREGRHSICLTDAGRREAAPSGSTGAL